MTSTSGDWSPQFPLFRSTDLQHWTRAGAIFPHQPEWAAGSFWAPELVIDHGEILVYYVGRKRGGPLCVAVGTALAPAGPWTDQGPIVCEPDGSIDPAFARDETGKPFLIWKEDGNSERRPTPIWAQPLNEDLLHLAGDKTRVLVNEPESWEGGVVEAPYILRHDGRFYMFYAGNACCGTACNYAEGVARADHLLGPWTKDPAKPIVRPNGTWKCPGHGSAVSSLMGRDYFLYHAYPNSGSIYLGRESVLDEVTWGDDGWPQINHGLGPGEAGRDSTSAVIRDNFETSVSRLGWRWPVNHEPRMVVGGGRLSLWVGMDSLESYLALPTQSSSYVAEVTVDGNGDAFGSIAVIGNANHATGLARRRSNLELWSKEEPGDRKITWHAEVPANATVTLRVNAGNGGKQLAYSYSTDRVNWTQAGDTIDVSGLPQWDQGLAVGLAADGVQGTRANFHGFSMHSK
jgi:beta-xylosidase